METEDGIPSEEPVEPERELKTLAELHDDIEAALFAAQDIRRAAPGGPETPGVREESVVAVEQRLEEALLWTRRAIEIEEDASSAPRE